MEIRIVKENIRGRTLPIYFLDIKDKLGWKNYSSHDSKDEAIIELSKLQKEVYNEKF